MTLNVFALRSHYRLTILTSPLFVALGLSSCAPHISPFSQTAYRQATSLKVESLELMNEATTPYEEHEQDVEELRTEVEKAYEYAKGLPNNEVTTRQWDILKDPGRNLLGGFLERWRERSTLSRAFVDEAKALVADAFDTIIGLESGKIKS